MNVVDLSEDYWCVSCNERPKANSLSLCLECAEAEFGDTPWVTGPDGVTQMTEGEAVSEALRVLGVNRASLRGQERARRMHGKGFTKAKKRPKRKKKR